MIEIWRILIPLLLAHIITDFFVQSNSMLTRKRESGVLNATIIIHASIAGILAYVFVAKWSLHEVLWVTFLTHCFINMWNSTRRNPENLHFFWIGQSLHLMVIVGLTVWVVGIDQVFIVTSYFPFRETGIIVTGLLFVLHPCSVIIGKVMGKWNISGSENSDEKRDLEKAGHVIGLLERVLIFLFIVINQFAAIGLLIAAKSILRFGSVKDKERKESEYILVGTLLSFTLATLTGLIVKILI